MDSDTEVMGMCTYAVYIRETDEHIVALGSEDKSSIRHRRDPKPKKTFRHNPLATSEAYRFAKYLDAGVGI